MSRFVEWLGLMPIHWEWGFVMKKDIKLIYIILIFLVVMTGLFLLGVFNNLIGSRSSETMEAVKPPRAIEETRIQPSAGSVRRDAAAQSSLESTPTPMVQYDARPSEAGTVIRETGTQSSAHILALIPPDADPRQFQVLEDHGMVQVSRPRTAADRSELPASATKYQEVISDDYEVVNQDGAVRMVRPRSKPAQ